MTPYLKNLEEDLVFKAPDGKKLKAKAELNLGVFLQHDFMMVRSKHVQQIISTKDLEQVLFCDYDNQKL